MDHSILSWRSHDQKMKSHDQHTTPKSYNNIIPPLTSSFPLGEKAKHVIGPCNYYTKWVMRSSTFSSSPHLASRHQSHTLTILDVPESTGLVRWPCCYVPPIWMKPHNLNEIIIVQKELHSLTYFMAILTHCIARNIGRNSAAIGWFYWWLWRQTAWFILISCQIFQLYCTSVVHTSTAAVCPANILRG